jgi:hypothetical protein
MDSPDNAHHVNFQSSVDAPFGDAFDVEQNIPNVSGDVSFAPVTPLWIIGSQLSSPLSCWLSSVCSY